VTATHILTFWHTEKFSCGAHTIITAPSIVTRIEADFSLKNSFQLQIISQCLRFSEIGAINKLRTLHKEELGHADLLEKWRLNIRIKIIAGKKNQYFLGDQMLSKNFKMCCLILQFVCAKIPRVQREKFRPQMLFPLIYFHYNVMRG